MASQGTWSIGFLEVALGIAVVILVILKEVTMLWIAAAVPMMIGGLFIFSGGLFVALPGIVVVLAIAIDTLIGRLRR